MKIKTWSVLVLFLVGFCAFLILSWFRVIAFPYQFDHVYTSRVVNAANHPQLLITAGVSSVFSDHILGAPRKIGGPYTFRICTDPNFVEVSAPHRAELFRVVNGRFVPVEADIDVDQEWTSYPTKDCILDFYVAGIEIDSQERYCLDLLFDNHGVERSERTCWDFTRHIGKEKIAIFDNRYR